MSHKRDDRHDHHKEQELKDPNKLPHIEHTEHQELAELRRIRHDLDLLVSVLVHHIPPQTGFTIYQGDHMSITGIVVGATGTFAATVLPAGAVIPAGSVPVWTTSDTSNTSLTPSADGMSVAVATSAAAPVGGSFILTITNQDGTFPTPVTVPYLPAAPPAQTGFEVEQTS